MAKAKAHPDQLGFVFEAPKAPVGEAALAGLEQRVNRMVGSMLNSDERPREVIAAEMTVLLGEKVSRKMLDAYASPAREEHKVPFSRLLALVLVTKRHDLLDERMREAGMAVLFGDEVKTARLGDIKRRIAALKEEERAIERSSPVIRGNGS